jgi:hypothetical protein
MSKCIVETGEINDRRMWIGIDRCKGAEDSAETYCSYYTSLMFVKNSCGWIGMLLQTILKSAGLS